MKLLLIDLDGTIRRCKSNPEGFINNPDDQELIPGAIEALREYVANGWTICGITNQKGVMLSYKSLESCIQEQIRTIELCDRLISFILFCPDNGDTCVRVHSGLLDEEKGYFKTTYAAGPTLGGFINSFRKPSPEMFHLATALAVSANNKPPTSFLVVGDRREDFLAAEAMQCDFIWAHTWRSR